MVRFVYRLPESALKGDVYRLTWQKQAGTDRIPVTITVTAEGAEFTADGLNWEQLAGGGVRYRGDLRRDISIALPWRQP
jgi:hypothetical protein